MSALHLSDDKFICSTHHLLSVTSFSTAQPFPFKDDFPTQMFLSLYKYKNQIKTVNKKRNIYEQRQQDISKTINATTLQSSPPYLVKIIKQQSLNIFSKFIISSLKKLLNFTIKSNHNTIMHLACLLSLLYLIRYISNACTTGNEPNCATYNTAPPTGNCPCTLCNSLFYLGTSSPATYCMLCSNAIYNCKDCTSNGVCTSCIVGSYVNASICASCTTISPGCSTCTNNTCTSCSPNTHFMDGNNNCLKCNNKTLDCVSCNPDTTCTSCDTYAYLDTVNNCQLCKIGNPNCQNCTNTTICQGCLNGFYLDAGNTICSSCFGIFGICGRCTSASCQACYSNATLVSGICVACNTLITNCRSCSSPSVCLLCSDSYTVVANSCSSCSSFIPNCRSCPNTSVCTVCLNNTYVLNSSDTSCPLCSDIIAGCDICSNSTNCNTCNTLHALVQINKTCLLCSSAIVSCKNCMFSGNLLRCTTCVNMTYFANSSGCHLCNSSPYISNCYLCFSNSACKQFQSYYYFAANNSCLPCFPTCVTCTSTQCLSCSYNTYLSQNSCHLCSVYLVGCMTCANSTHCLYCINKTYLLINGRCYICALSLICSQSANGTIQIKCGLGHLVNGGCTRATGCLMANPLLLLNLTQNCLGCNNTQFYLSKVDGTCVCKQGWLIGQHCGTNVGCSNLATINSTLVCVSCHTNQYFILVNGACVCQTYYYQHGLTCSEKCGDGYLFILQCDDGNTIDGDGCSSTCQVQQSYICKETGSFPASRCMYKGRVQLTVNQINRLPNTNSATVTFEVAPYVSALTKMSLSNLTNFKADFCQMESASIVNQQLIITFSFNKTVTNDVANVFLQYDRNYIISPNSTVNFKLRVLSGNLIFYPHIGDINQNLIKIMQYASYATLGTFAAGSLAYKMIGVQTIHTIQLIMLLVVKSEAYPYLFVQLSNFTIAYGQFYQIYSPNGANLIKEQQQLSQLEYTESPLQNYLMLSVIQTTALVLYCVLSLYLIHIKDIMSQINYNLIKKSNIQQYLKRSQQKDKQKTKHLTNKLKLISGRLNTVEKVLACVEDWFLFPFLIGFMFHFFITIFVQDIFTIDPSTLTFKISIVVIVIIILGKCLVFTGQVKPIFIKKGTANDPLLRSEYQRSYIPLYLLSELLLFVVITTGLLQFIDLVFEASAVMILTHLVFVCFQRPYEQGVHNFSIILNQLTLTFAVGWLIYEKYFAVTFEMQTLLLYCLIGLIVAVLFFSLTRTMFAVWKIYLISKRGEELRPTAPQTHRHAEILKEQDKKGRGLDQDKPTLVKDVLYYRNRLNATSLFETELLKSKAIKTNMQVQNSASILAQIQSQNEKKSKNRGRDQYQMILKQSRVDYQIKLMEE